MTEHDERMNRFERWLPGGLNDLAGLTALASFCRLFTARCLESRYDRRQVLYRSARGITTSLLTPAERIVVRCARGFRTVEEIISEAAGEIRREIPESRRGLTSEDAGAFTEIQTTLAEALAYEPPVSSCSV
jgi:hypothetical protein